jgi:hypothetical protein
MDEDVDQSLITIMAIVAVGGITAFLIKTGLPLQLINAFL